ncbi:MAG: hypothetical protein JW984_03050 [Deltaproteobacteria bacterium]|uniref:Uncharacterized protein n=1 Tax=Candidatus Zymogenus saltonus TaxID=2844893 RepID=A0A9D8KEF6_9DELT|nr:hypothetical protein [Candidatus Zymogenus saltonus]
MKKYRFEITLVVSLILSSVIMYLIHYLIFHDLHHIGIYMIGDIAIMPIEVLIVTLIIHRLLQVREKRKLMTKLNIVIGAFFSEIGEELVKAFSDADKNIGAIRGKILETNHWSNSEVSLLSKLVDSYEPEIESRDYNLENLRSFLFERRVFLLRLLENPNLLEHDSFTDLLWAVTHLQEELYFREDFVSLPESDFAHLTLDIKRAYRSVIKEWVLYMKHLHDNYPYLFSLAKRMNPFDANASIIVK